MENETVNKQTFWLMFPLKSLHETGCLDFPGVLKAEADGVLFVKMLKELINTVTVV